MLEQSSFQLMRSVGRMSCSRTNSISFLRIYRTRTLTIKRTTGSSFDLLAMLLSGNYPKRISISCFINKYVDERQALFSLLQKK